MQNFIVPNHFLSVRLMYRVRLVYCASWSRDEVRDDRPIEFLVSFSFFKEFQKLLKNESVPLLATTALFASQSLKIFGEKNIAKLC